MNNLVVLPLLLPVLTGILLIFLRQYIRVQRKVSFWMTLVNAMVALYLMQTVYTDGIQTLELGGWAAPYGIVFVADMLAVILVSVTFIVAFACIWYSFRSIGNGREAYFFYPIVQFLIAGVNGSFLTGDIFNLFVCFEVMLISSYVLIVLGGTKLQLRESIKYLLVNIVSSTLFVVGVALLYRLTGTLNMAHLSERVAETGMQGMYIVISLFFMIVFSLKAALFLYYWLPGSYSAPPTAIVALFSALLTKVGIYALIRMFTLIFYHQPQITHEILAWMAALTMVLGTVGALAYRNVKQILVYNVIAGVGFIILGLASASLAGYSGAVYYLIHDMIVKALLFLAVGVLIRIAGTDNLQRMGGYIKQAPLLGWIIFLTAISLAGIPPLSGFIGKLLIVQGSVESGYYVFTGVALLSSLLLLYSLIRMFMLAFWGEQRATEQEVQERENASGWVLPCALLLSLSIVIGIGAEWLQPYVEQAAQTLANPDSYIQAVLKE